MHPNDTCLNAHCIKVCKVYDWVSQAAFLELQEEIQLGGKLFTDCICCSFHIPCGEEEPTTLWTSYGIQHIGGSICIEYKNGCGQLLDVFINHEKVASLFEGSSFSASYSALETVEIKCNGTTVVGSCCGEFKINVHVEPTSKCDLHSFQDIKKVKCYLSDCHGYPISHKHRCGLRCKELTDPDERTEFEFFKPGGEKTILHRVEILKQGFVTIEIFNCKNVLCRKCTFPFSKIETFFLCAPSGTIVDCDITSADCKAHIIPPMDHCSKCVKIEIKLILCQSVSSLAEVIMEVKADACMPREELVIDSSCSS
jgi:hypothetical protein